LAQERSLTALFANTFYWIALVDFNDTAHLRALALSSERADFFSTAPEQMRRKALINARRILDAPGVRVPQSRESFLAGLALYTGAMRSRAPQRAVGEFVTPGEFTVMAP
jgi:hypothetical protein